MDEKTYALKGTELEAILESLLTIYASIEDKSNTGLAGAEICTPCKFGLKACLQLGPRPRVVIRPC